MGLAVEGVKLPKFRKSRNEMQSHDPHSTHQLPLIFGISEKVVPHRFYMRCIRLVLYLLVIRSNQQLWEQYDVRALAFASKVSWLLGVCNKLNLSSSLSIICPLLSIQPQPNRKTSCRESFCCSRNATCIYIWHPHISSLPFPIQKRK